MINKIKIKIERELKKFCSQINKLYSLNKLSPLLFTNIQDFLLRKGKRLRPVLFVLGYLGFAKRLAPNLYTSALSLEIFHSFMLVHDDIIDKSDTRRGKPSMHAGLNNYLRKFKKIKFCGEDLTIVIGDVMYALAINAFLSIKESMDRKEAALRKFIEAAIYTGSGEFIELLNGIKSIENITKDDIYRIYDYKTACYSFSTPLATGAILAGASEPQVDKLFEYGIYLGRAFQIKDDIIGIFDSEKEIGKPLLTDLQEAKKTIIIWHAFKNSNPKERLIIKKVLSKEKVTKTDLVKIRKLIIRSNALNYAKDEIRSLLKKAESINLALQMNSNIKKTLHNYCLSLLSLEDK